MRTFIKILLHPIKFIRFLHTKSRVDSLKITVTMVDIHNYSELYDFFFRKKNNMPRKSHTSIIKDRFLSIKSKAIGYDTLKITMADGTQYFIFLHNVTLEGKVLDLGKANIKLALDDIKDVRIIVQNS